MQLSHWLGVGMFLLAGQSVWAGDIHATNAWIREAPPSAKALAAYMVITNSGKESVQLKGADCSEFESVEVHRSMMENGMMHMMALESLAIAPGTSALLEPGGYHLMLIEPRKHFQAGDQVQVRLHFDRNEDLAVQAVVKKAR